MTAIAKTIVATGVSSGLGHEALKQLLQSKQPYRILMGARNVPNAQAAVDKISFDKSSGRSVSVLPVELSNLPTVQRFAQQTLEQLGGDKIDYLLLNAGIQKPATGDGPYGSRWSEILIVNHVAQFYLVHLLRDRLVKDQSRILFVSSGAVRNVPDPKVMDQDMMAHGTSEHGPAYCQSKFIQLLGAQWWQRQLGSTNRVIATSPGMIPGTGLFYGTIPEHMKTHADAKSNAEGGSNVLRALLWEDEFPKDPEQMFMTSWGEWWPKDVYEQALDQKLQDKWCFSKEEIDKEAELQAKNA